MYVFTFLDFEKYRFEILKVLYRLLMLDSSHVRFAVEIE